MNINNILWIPLDLPQVPRELTLENIESFYTHIPTFTPDEQKQLARNKQYYKYAWNSYRIREIDQQAAGWENQHKEESWRWTASAKANCPGLINYIENFLPLTKIRGASVMSSKGTIPAHYDLSPTLPDEEKQPYINNDPCMYRLLLDGNIHQDSFFVRRDDKKYYVNMPSDAPGWAMGSFSCLHGNDEETPYQKIILYIIGEIDVDRHRELISKSYERYKEYAVLI
jgi:hypothetical protein